MKISEFADFCDSYSHIKAVKITRKDKMEIYKMGAYKK